VRPPWSIIGRTARAPCLRGPVSSTLGVTRHMRAIALKSIRLYQRFLSPYKGFSCAYRVHTGSRSCSALGYRAISRYGFAGGISVLRKRLHLCGVAYRRFGATAQRFRELQRGSMDCACDLPCDGDCSPDLNCGSNGRVLSWCCDGCSCDGPARKKKSPEEKYVYLPPNAGKL
jgi:uncharacterized protein